MRLALLSVHSCPLGKLGGKDTGGMNVYVRELAVNLGRQGHTIDIFTRRHDSSDPTVIELGPNTRLVHLHAGNTEEESNKLALYAYLPEFAGNLENFRRENRLEYDLIFSHYWLSGKAGNLLRTWWHVPHMVMFHTLGMVKNSLETDEDEPEPRLETEKILVQECERVIATTEYEKNLLTTQYDITPGKITVVPCGVNLDLFKPIDRQTARKQLNLDEHGKIILFVGRTEKLKAIDRIIEAISILKHIPNLQLLIVGGDEHSHEEFSRLQNLASTLGIQRLVRFIAAVPQEMLPCYYSAANVCVLASYYESFGMVALEALACGTPVVATRVGDLENIIQPGVTGYIAPDNTPVHLGETLSRVLTQDQLADQETIRSSVARFSWENISQQIAADCEIVIAGYSGHQPG